MIYEIAPKVNKGTYFKKPWMDQTRCVSVKRALPSNADCLCFLYSYNVTLTHIAFFL